MNMYMRAYVDNSGATACNHVTNPACLLAVTAAAVYVISQAAHVLVQFCWCCCDSLGWYDVALLDVLHNFVQQRCMRLRSSTLCPPARHADVLDMLQVLLVSSLDLAKHPA
jgi:hypothetical protein